MVKNSIFRFLGLRKRLGRSRKPLYKSKIFFSVYRVPGSQNDRLELTVSMQKIGFKNCALSQKILAKMCQNFSRQTKPAYFQTFWPISWDSVHIFKNRFLR